MDTLYCFAICLNATHLIEFLEMDGVACRHVFVGSDTISIYM